MSETKDNQDSSKNNSSGGSNSNNNNDDDDSNGKSKEKDEATNKEILNNAMLFNACTYTSQELKQLVLNGDTKSSFIKLSTLSNTEEFTRVVPMTFTEHFCAFFILTFGIPVGVFTIPTALYIIGKFVVGNVLRTYQFFFVFFCVPSILLPQPFVPSILTSWLVVQIMKYFSYRHIVEDYESTFGTDHIPSKERPRIYVAPPHGIFPYGNILCTFMHPCMVCAVGGGTFRGLASSAALRTPIFKNLFRSIGIIDASRDVAKKALQTPDYTIGISTGGVAEVFQTNHNDQCILLKERIGLIKLALRTGADLVPCYVFGNTEMLKGWSFDGIPFVHDILQTISRKIGFALIIIYGRFGLPIPCRTPILSVMGKPIPTYTEKTENPSEELLLKYQELVINETMEIFERYKGLYGWQDKKLIIK